VIPFCFQDFESFSLSLFGILDQGDSLSLPLWFGLVGIYPVPLLAGYSSVSLHLVYIAVFWVSLTVEKFFTFNLDVLSMVLYRWRSLEATVKTRQKPESGGLISNPENTRELLTPGNINQ